MAASRGDARMPAALTSGRLGPLMSLFYQYGPPRWSRYVRENWSGQRVVIGVPFLWLLLFFVVPFLIVFKLSFSEVRVAEEVLAVEAVRFNAFLQVLRSLS